MDPKVASIDDVAISFANASKHSMLLGAGLSVAESKLPVFALLFEQCLKSLVKNEIEADYYKELLMGLMRNQGTTNKILRPEEFFAAVEAEAPGSATSLVSKVFGVGSPGPSHQIVGVLSSQLRYPILTTNFDCLLEAATPDIQFIHLHGSVRNKNSIRIAVNDVAGYNVRRVRRTALKFVRDFNVYVAGYQGLDSDIFPLLDEARHVYWLVYAKLTDNPLIIY